MQHNESKDTVIIIEDYDWAKHIKAFFHRSFDIIIYPTDCIAGEEIEKFKQATIKKANTLWLLLSPENAEEVIEYTEEFKEKKKVIVIQCRVVDDTIIEIIGKELILPKKAKTTMSIYKTKELACAAISNHLKGETEKHTPKKNKKIFTLITMPP